MSSRWRIVVLQAGRSSREVRSTSILGVATTLALLPGLACLTGAVVSAPTPRAEAIAVGAPQPRALEPTSTPDEHEGDEPQILEATPPTPAPVAAAEISIPSLVTRGQRPPLSGRSVIRLRALADGDTYEGNPFLDDGQIDPAAFQALSYVMRYRATGARPPAVHPRLAALLVRISRQWDDRYLRMVSGYREVGRGTAATSYHARGMAIDIEVRDVDVEELYRIATEAGAFGVGMYPHDGFVHVDVRSIPHRWVQNEEGENVPLPHPPRWRLARRFGELLAVGARPSEPWADTGPRRCSGIRPPDRGPFWRRVALTFDGGPSEHTERLLRVLRRHRAPATFFVQGAGIESGAATLRAAATDGIDIGSYAHRGEHFGDADADTLEASVTRASEALHAAGLDPTFFRFPEGRANCGVTARARHLGYPIAGWHIDSADQCFDEGEGACLDDERYGPEITEHSFSEHILAHVDAHGGGIVRFHDGSATTAEELDAVLTTLEARGYSFVPLTERTAFPELTEDLSASRARRLGLGTRRVAHELMEGRVEPGWQIAAGGDTPPRTLEWPVERAVVARGFGSGEDGYHLAVDIAGVRGTEVHSVARGLVAYAGDGIPGYGNTVIVVHPGGLVSFYAHNDRNLARAGQRVARGDVLGTVGDTGLARGPHVHFELSWNEMACDPAPLFRPLPESRRGPIEGLEAREWRDASAAPVPCEARRAHPRSRWAVR